MTAPSPPPTASFDPVELEILWQSLISTVNEQARALQRAAFSPIVREAGDLANAVFDRRGRMVAQAVTGTPGHINSLAIGAANMLAEYPVDSLEPGDVLITNDPYKTAGQLLDVTVLVPAWRNGKVIAFFGSTIQDSPRSSEVRARSSLPAAGSTTGPEARGCEVRNAGPIRRASVDGDSSTANPCPRRASINSVSDGATHHPRGEESASRTSTSGRHGARTPCSRWPRSLMNTHGMRTASLRASMRCGVLRL